MKNKPRQFFIPTMYKIFYFFTLYFIWLYLEILQSIQGCTISNNYGEKWMKLWTNDDMVGNLSLETPSGFTIAFTI